MKITITRVEGPIKECGKSHTVESFTDANILLRRMSNSAPEKGGYDKCDFRIEGDFNGDALDYKGRYDLKHWRCEQPDLKEHVVSFADFQSGNRRPSHMTQEQYDRYLNEHVPQERRSQWAALTVWFKEQP